MNESSSFAVTIEGTYEEVKQCLRGDSEEKAEMGAINGMEVISEEEVDDSSVMAKSRTSRYLSSSKKPAHRVGLGSTMKEVHNL